MDVLRALIRRAPEVAPKQEIIEEVWEGAFVTDEVLTHAIWDLRRAFGDNASKPEFIQTIPKRGYRLIAPVKKIEAASPEAGERTFISRPVLAGLLAVVAVLAAASFWFGRNNPSPPPPDAGKPVLTLVATDPTEVPPGWAESLDKHLGAELSGLSNINARNGESCDTSPRVGLSYCLRLVPVSVTDGFQVLARLTEAHSSNLVYSTPYVDLARRSDLSAAAAELSALIATCLEVLRDWRINEPDIRPWVSLQKHDVRAVRDFLVGVDYVYRNEVGGRVPLEHAIAIDPLFVAPRVWRTPTLVGESDASIVAEHRRQLQNLYGSANEFEKTMISWALAFIDGDWPEQLRHLRVALKREPENRPLRMIQAATLLRLEDVDQAWQTLERLLQKDWCHPALYALSARIALMRQEPQDAKEALELALRCDPVDPHSLALLQLLAVYEGDSEKEAHYGGWLERRQKEMQPEPEVDVSMSAGLLAAKAENEGRTEISARLREFAN